jgi:NAD(P)-dependent dehydrogenase (short-subunit alcohol dehydrogenase family)
MSAWAATGTLKNQDRQGGTGRMISAMNLQKLFGLEGRIAFISAARGHLGAAMTRALAGAGAHVIINGRDDAALADYEKKLRAEGFAVERAAFDATDSAALKAFFGGLKRLDILVNNAVSMTVKPFAALNEDDFARTYASSVTASFTAVRAALPALKEGVAQAGDASVINIASMYAGVAPDFRIYDAPEGQSPFHYGPAKAGLVQLSRHLAAELGPQKIRVNALVPGPFPNQPEPKFGARLGQRTMLGRFGRPEEIGGPLLFLASPASSFITGSALTVDGGWTAW